jgi:hypothetical protein
MPEVVQPMPLTQKVVMACRVPRTASRTLKVLTSRIQSPGLRPCVLIVQSQQQRENRTVTFRAGEVNLPT